MKKIFNCMILGCMILALFTACGATASGQITETTMNIRRNGQMDLALVDVFDREYYEYAELLAMAQLEVETHPGGGVSFQESHQFMDGSNKVMIQYRFDNATTCEAFMQETCFLGTVREALDKKLLTNVILRPETGGEVISQTELLQMGEQRVLITEINALIECPWKVAYFSEGVLVKGKGMFNTTDAEGISVIVFE